MHTWYRVVCDAHKETIDFFVDTPSRTSIYLSERDADIYAWLELHCACDLRLVHRGDQMDAIWNAGYFDPIKNLPPGADPAKGIPPPGQKSVSVKAQASIVKVEPTGPQT